MRRLNFVVQFVLLILIGCGVYRVANQYQIIEKQVAHYDVAAEEEHENIRVLEAEWAFLTAPARLEKIGRDYFQLQPVDGSQMVAINDIPVRAALDAQEIKVDPAASVATNDTKLVAPQKSLPKGVTPVAATQNTTIAAAVPQALPPVQALPPMIATPVSDQREVQ